MDSKISLSGITIGKKTFKVGNQELFLNSGEVHYFRIKRDDWEDRLSKAKEMGLNAISTYIPWNYHEVEEGVFDFESYEKDLDHFLHLCENRGFYILIRPGPYVHSELINGGLPQWLIEEHPKIMCYDDTYSISEYEKSWGPAISYGSQTYLKYVELYIREVGDIVRRHLYPHGGVILVQPDNEISYAGKKGIYEVDYNPMHLESYKKFLEDKYQKIGRVNKAYNTKFIDFFSITPPTQASFDQAASSMNEFQHKGEFIRLLDWMESKEYAIQEYTRQVCYFFRKSGLMVPYYVNLFGHASPSDAVKQYNAYKTKILVGDDLYLQTLKQELEGDLRLELHFEQLKARLPHLLFIPELQGGFYDKMVPPNQTHLLTRASLGHGMKALNYYMAVGGITPTGTYNGEPFLYSAVEKSIGYDGKKYYVDESGESYDYGAAVGCMGQKSPRFEVIKLFSKYLTMNKTKLLSSTKVYDDIAYLYYHPYTRIKFNTKKLGAPLDYRRHVREDEESEFLKFVRTLNRMGIHPTAIDPELAETEDLLDKKIIIAPLCNFMDNYSMKKLKRFVEVGGTIISFSDLPVKNERMMKDNTLLDIYRAKIDHQEHDKKINFLGEEFSSFGLLFSYKFLKPEGDLNAPDFNLKYSFRNINEKDILAYTVEKGKKKVMAFRRQYGKGQIFHLGFVITPDEAGMEMMEKLLNKAGFTGKKTLCTEEIKIIRQRATDGEEFVTAVNLQNEDLQHVEMTLTDREDWIDKSKNLTITNMAVPAKSALQWTINRKLNDYLTIGACTSEINLIQSIRRLKPKQNKIEGYHFENSRNVMKLVLKKKPKNILFGDKDITEIVEKNSNDLGIYLEDKTKNAENPLFLLTAFYYGNFNFILKFGSADNDLEDINFNFKEIENFSLE